VCHAQDCQAPRPTLNRINHAARLSRRLRTRSRQRAAEHLRVLEVFDLGLLAQSSQFCVSGDHDATVMRRRLRHAEGCRPGRCSYHPRHHPRSHTVPAPYSPDSASWYSTALPRQALHRRRFATCAPSRAALKAWHNPPASGSTRRMQKMPTDPVKERRSRQIVREYGRAWSYLWVAKVRQVLVLLFRQLDSQAQRKHRQTSAGDDRLRAVHSAVRMTVSLHVSMRELPLAPRSLR